MNESGHFTIRDIIFDRDQDPDHHAIECPGFHPLTYRDLRLQILYVVKTLNTLGFHRNDRIAIITPTGPETAVIIISVMAGFTALTIESTGPGSGVQHVFFTTEHKSRYCPEGV